FIGFKEACEHGSLAPHVRRTPKETDLIGRFSAQWRARAFRCSGGIRVIEGANAVHRQSSPALNGARSDFVSDEPPGELIATQVTGEASVRDAHDPFSSPGSLISRG